VINFEITTEIFRLEVFFSTRLQAEHLCDEISFNVSRMEKNIFEDKLMLDENENICVEQNMGKSETEAVASSCCCADCLQNIVMFM